MATQSNVLRTKPIERLYQEKLREREWAKLAT